MESSRQIQSPVLVGRDEVLTGLAQTVADALAGRGQMLLIAGEAGIGKSRIVSTLTRQARQSGFRVASGDVAPQDQLVSLASLFDVARGMQARAAEFGDLGPALLSMRAGASGDSLSARRILVHEIADRIIAAIDRPTALVFEDIHWADELTLEVVGELARQGSGLPLLVVATYRPEELAAGSIHREWRARLLTQRVAQEVRLERLTPAETAQVVTLILGTGLPAARDVAEAVHDRSNGIPLHIEELLAAMGDAAIDGRTIRDVTVPSTIEDAVLARLGRLDADAQATARAGAVMGRCFAPDVLAGVMGRVPSELEASLDALVAAGFLYPFQNVEDGYYDFRHQLLRDAVYDSVPTKERRRLHASAAEFGTVLIGATEVHRSVHYERAGMRAEAFRAALAGAEAAAAITSRFEAFELYRHAVANIPDDLPPGAAGGVWLSYCYAGLAVDDVASAEDAATHARPLLLEAGERAKAADCLLLHAVLARRDVRPRSERQALLAAAAEELAALPRTQEVVLLQIEIRLLQAILEIDVANKAAAVRILDDVRALADEAELVATPGEITRIDMENDLAWVEVLGGDAQGGLARMLALSREARDARFEATAVTGYRTTGDVAARVMEYATARAAIAEGIRYADEVEQSYCRHVMSADSALLAWASGAWDDAVRTAELELVQRGSRRGTIGSRAVLAFVSFGRGDVDRARMLLDASLAISRPSGEVDLVLPALWGLAETAIIDGDSGRALDHCWEAVEIAEPTGERALLVPFVVTGVRAALQHHRPDLAQKWLDRIDPMLSKWTELAQPARDHADGLIRTASGATVAARSSLEAAIAGWEARGRIWETTWARLDLVSALLRSNRHGEALPFIADVLATARRLGSLPLLRRAEELDRSARTRAVEREPWYPLSAREFEVARLVSQGLTNAEIAEQLFVSPKTASAHIEHILDKLGVARRTEIATWVSAIGGIPVS